MKTQRFTGLRSALAGTTSVAVLAAALATQAAAQQANTDEEDEDIIQVEEVVVTGSRIARTGIDTVEPAIVLDRELLEKRNFTNVADLLNEAPAFGAPAASPVGVQNGFSVGQNVVDFLGLGSARTLTLVNGRRFVSSNAPTVFGEAGGLQVDFNVLPVSLVERIETIATGGAPIYGSDAIAGTINVILRDDFEGFEVSGQHGFSDLGGGNSYQIQSILGGNFADGKGNAVIAFEYNTQKGVRGGQRPLFSIGEPSISEIPASASGIDADGDGEDDPINAIFGESFVQLFTDGGIASPGNLVIPSLGLGAFPDGNFYRFEDGTGNLVQCEPSTSFPGGSLFFGEGGTCTSDLFDRVNQIQSPLDRVIISGLGDYKINDYVTAFMEFTVANTEARELGNQSGFQTFAFDGPTSLNAQGIFESSGALVFDLTNPFLTDQARSVLEANELDEFRVSRLLNDVLSEGDLGSENFVWRAVAGFEGDFNYADRNFTWEVSANFGQADIDTFGTGLIEGRYFNALDAVALTADDAALGGAFDGLIGLRNGQAITYNAGDPATAPQAGDIVCSVIQQEAAGTLEPTVTGNGLTKIEEPFVDGCVPLNVFGQGNAAPEALTWVNGRRTTASELQQRVFSANLTGELIELPGGMASFGVGYENRKEIGQFIPDGFTSLGLDRSSPFAPTGGRFSTDEIYAELFIPILDADMVPFIDSLTFEPKYRYVDNSLAGGDSTFTLGGTMGVLGMFTFRGNYTEAIRSPSVQELFAPRTQVFDFVTDPCDERQINDGPSPATRQANCAADGITQPFTSNAQNASIVGFTTGNENLSNEKAESYSFGVVFEPSEYLAGFTLTADYLNIQIADRIANLDPTDLATACYDSPDFPNVSACDGITRDGTGQIITFSSGFANAATSDFEAVTFDIRYDFPVADALGLISSDLKDNDLGDLLIRLNGFRRIKNDLSVVGEDPINNIGEFGQNRWSGTFDVTYDWRDLQVFWRVLWQDNSLLDAEGDNFFQNADGELITGTGDRYIHNASVSYEVLEGVSVRFAVDNVFNRRGTLTQRAYGDTGFAELFGRRFRLTGRVRF